MSAGRPFRFLAFVTGAWTATRIALLWPTIVTLPDLVRAVLPVQTAAADARPAPLVARIVSELPPAVHRFGRQALTTAEIAPDPRAQMIVALAGIVNYGAPVYSDKPSQAVAQPPVIAAPAPPHPGSRWSGSAWLLGRSGAGGTLDAPQLGGGQAGLRIAYLLDRRHRLALAARVAVPLQGKGREAAIGLDWQPTRWPVRLLLEQRFGLDGQRGGPAALVVGGFGPSPIGRKFTLEGYGEAGVVDRHRLDGFADGALRLARPIATVERIAFDLGIGAWGAAQRGVRRLDIGPSVAARIPLDARRALRLGVDWRQRVAGNARPGSGPAVTLGADF